MDFPVGEIASLGAAASWAVGLNLFRRDVREIGARPVNFFKGAVGTLAFTILLLFTGAPSIPVARQFDLALSGLVGLALGDSLLFMALGQMGPHRAALFAILGPAMTALGGFLLLGERLPLAKLAGIGAALAGLALVVYYRKRGHSGGSATLLGVVCGLLSAVCQAGGVLLSKRGMAGGDVIAASALRLGSATVALALVAALRGDLGSQVRRLAAPGPLKRLLPAVGVGTLLGVGLMQLGIARTESAVASALHSTTPLFTLPISVFLLRERMGAKSLFGTLLAVGGVILLLLS